jgi:subtilisin family serine protease
MIKRVVPLTRPSSQPQASLGSGMGALGIFINSLNPTSSSSIHTGVNILELTKNSDLLQLQTAFANDPHVEFASRVPKRYLLDATVPPNDVAMWNLRKIRWEEAQACAGFKKATNIRVAVLDTGVDYNHPDLKGAVSKDDYTFTYSDLPESSTENDIVGHGTHVVGIICALKNNFGITGICDCKLFVWKIFDDKTDLEMAPFGPAFVYEVDPIMYRRALADCLDLNIDVINLSIGGTASPDPEEDRLINLLLAKGTIIVAAMGNSRMKGSPIFYPAAMNNVIAVGATSIDDTIADFSNRGNHIALCAPGVGIWSTLPTYPGQYGFLAIPGSGNMIEGQPISRETDYFADSGTSMATPHVTAAVALLLANKGKTSPQDAKELLMKSSDKLQGMNGLNWDPDYGAGRLNLEKLLK